MQPHSQNDDDALEASMPDRQVLVVDDDPDWRDAMRLSLEDLGYQVTLAHDGEGALAALKETHFSVVLLDLRMPGLSGEEVSRAIGEDGPRIVFVTGAEDEELSAAMRTGPRYYLPKVAGTSQLKLLMHSLSLS